MPMYEYKCDACEQISRALQNIGAQPPETCRECGKQGTLTRIMSVSNFHLKGGGWYDTAYDKVPAASGKKEETSAESAAPSSTDSSSTSSDSSASSSSTTPSSSTPSGDTT